MPESFVSLFLVRLTVYRPRPLPMQGMKSALFTACAAGQNHVVQVLIAAGAKTEGVRVPVHARVIFSVPTVTSSRDLRGSVSDDGYHHARQRFIPESCKTRSLAARVVLCTCDKRLSWCCVCSMTPMMAWLLQLQRVMTPSLKRCCQLG